MLPVLSLVSSVKDYLEVVHKLISYDSLSIQNYSEVGSIVSYFVISLKNFLVDFLSFSWLKTIWSIPLVIPDISAAMISEISVLDGYFHNAFQFLETPLSYGEKNGFVALIEKFTIGVLNSLFLFLPTSTAHIITLRRFVMQGLSAGYISGLGTLAGNVFWLASVILGWRFFVIPWLSLDIFRYVLGFILLVKYMWDSYNEQRRAPSGGELENSTKVKIFFLTFLLALTEQTSIYPFISNITLSPETSILESFPATNYAMFIGLHFSYLAGITLGSFCLLQFTCWFWENPAFKIYMWAISSFKVKTSVYYKVINFVFLYLTMISAISSIPYYGLDYTLTNPLGFVNEDRLIQDKVILETSFLGSKAEDRNTRRNRGRHGRRERWKRRIRKNRAFDASLYDQGLYDLFTIEDLNYGFSRFWLRRKLRNHRVRFRFFPGPWMRGFKKQLAKPRLESYTGPRMEFFRILFEQVYHPAFHARQSNTFAKQNIKGSLVTSSSTNSQQINNTKENLKEKTLLDINRKTGMIFNHNKRKTIEKNLSFSGRVTQSVYRKLIRKLDTRLKTAQIALSLNKETSPLNKNKVYSKRWKEIFEKANYSSTAFSSSNSRLGLSSEGAIRHFYSNVLNSNTQQNGNRILKGLDALDEKQTIKQLPFSVGLSFSEGKKQSSTYLSTDTSKEEKILRYRSMLSNNVITEKATTGNSRILNNENSPYRGEKSSLYGTDRTLPPPGILFHPLKYYLQQETSFQRKLHYYTPSVFRKFSVENNAPYFRIMMRRYFSYFKPTNRWERTMKVASMRKERRKTTRIPRKLTTPSREKEESSTLRVGDQVVGSIGLVQERQMNTGVSNDKRPTDVETGLGLATTRLRKPTSSYSVLSKRASRYRYQIYKDVLQHWYYSPFNRFLLKLDVDSFIKRQPSSHFLTNKEENLLHLRRFLLSEHYNTLRWYTMMEHYRSMKTKIGGTKSFSSRVYNQQFTGTFKKIRHLFAITPSEINLRSDSSSTLKGTGNELSVLKFDQPLYNEYPNNTKNPLSVSLVIHEELAADDRFNETRLLDSTNLNGAGSISSKNEDLILQSQNIVRDYLINSTNERKEVISSLLKSNNYTGLTQFLFNGQKWRGDRPAINQQILNNQEVDYLLSKEEKNELKEKQKSKRKQQLKRLYSNLTSDLYTSFLKNWKRRVNNQETLKNYLTSRIDKRQKRKRNKEKNLQKKLSMLSSWILSYQNNGTNEATRENLGKRESEIKQFSSFTSGTTGLQKAIVDGLNVATTLPETNRVTNSYLVNRLSNSNSIYSNTVQYNNLKEIHISMQKLNSILVKKNESKTENISSFMYPDKAYFNSIRIIKNQIGFIEKQCQNVFTRVAKSGRKQLQFILNPSKQKTLSNWRQKQRALDKQKRLRKEFKLLKEEGNPGGTTGAPSRRKRVDDSSLFGTRFQVLTNLGSFKREQLPQRRYKNMRRGRSALRKQKRLDGLKKEMKLFLGANKEKKGEKTSDNLDLWKQDRLKKMNLKKKNRKAWKQKHAKFSEKSRKYLKRRRYALSKIRVLSKQLKRIKNQLFQRNWWWNQYVPSKKASTDALWQIEKDRLIQQKLSSLSPADIMKRAEAYPNNENSLQIGNKDFKPLSLPMTLRSIQNQTIDRSISSDGSNKGVQINTEETKGLVGTSFNVLQENKDNNLGKNLGVENVGVDRRASFPNEQTSDSLSFVQNLYENLFTNDSALLNPQTSSKSFTDLLPNTNLPFYAGWDESERKFVVTNRILSRQDAGFVDYSFNNFALNQQVGGSNEIEESNLKREFDLAPLQGMNAATTLYWQLPFTTYDPDQLFPLGMDGFSPITWRKFLFRHSILKSWLSQRQLITNASDSSSQSERSSETREADFVLKRTKNGYKKDLLSSLQSINNEKNSVFNNPSLIQDSQTFYSNAINVGSQSSDGFNKMRRLKKRLSRVKKHPRTPVWYPSGPLLNQVLPTHYIYVLYKRSRLPRNRYLGRRLLNAKAIQTSETLNKLKSDVAKEELSVFNPSFNFTLRKRLKPKRKYHLKHDSSTVIPRRLRFLKEINEDKSPREFGETIEKQLQTTNSDFIRWRPLSAKKINKPISSLINEQRLLRSKRIQRNKQMNAEKNQGETPSLRVKQLKRRVQRQILRSVWRYRPRAGGFVWPGDYLKLEYVKAPKLKTAVVKDKQNDDERSRFGVEATKKRKMGGAASTSNTRKKKRSLVEWNIQPKKYVYLKHNIKVIKKKLETSLRSQNKNQKVKEFSLRVKL